MKLKKLFIFKHSSRNFPLKLSPNTPAYYRWPVILEVTVNESGSVVSVCDLSQQRGIDAFVKTLKTARFKPGSLNSQAVPVTMEFKYHLPDFETLIEANKKE